MEKLNKKRYTTPESIVSEYESKYNIMIGSDGCHGCGSQLWGGCNGCGGNCGCTAPNSNIPDPNCNDTNDNSNGSDNIWEGFYN